MKQIAKLIAILGVAIPTTVATVTPQSEQTLAENGAAVVLSLLVSLGLSTERAQQLAAGLGWVRAHWNESDIPNGYNAEANWIMAGLQRGKSADDLRGDWNALLDKCEQHFATEGQGGTVDA